MSTSSSVNALTQRRRHSSLFERMENQIKKISKRLSVAKESYKEGSLKKRQEFRSFGSIDDHRSSIPTVRRNRPAYQLWQATFDAKSNSNTEKGSQNNVRGTKFNKRYTDAKKEKEMTFNEEKLSQNAKNMTAPLKRRILSNLATPTPAQTIELNPSSPYNYKDNARKVNFSYQYQNQHPMANSSNSPNINRIILKLQDENSKLNYELGKIQSICEQQSYRLGTMKGELTQTKKKLQQEKEKKEKENCYLSTLMQYYKGKAKKYKRMLRQQMQEGGENRLGDSEISSSVDGTINV